MSSPFSYGDEMSEYVLYSKAGCGWCDRLKTLLNDKSIPFTEVRIDASPDNLAELKSLYPEVKTVPQLFHHGVRIGGYTESEMYLTDVYDSSFGDDL